MTPDQYLYFKEKLLQHGYEEEIIWAETVGVPKDALTFFQEYAWVVLNSGMKNQVAEGIWKRLQPHLISGGKVFDVFKHPGKAKAIQQVWENREDYYFHFKHLPEDSRLPWLQSLPWIGPITKFHLAKNYGMDVCKPDRHLVRIAAKCEMTPEELCSSLALVTGDRIGVVDLVIWRAANLGWI
jgi:hypothetical protein